MFFRTAIVKSIFFLVFIMAGLLFSQPVYFNSNAKTGIEVNVLSSTNSSTIIEYIFNGYDQRSIDIKGKEYLFLSAPNMIWKMDKGDPQIPIFKHSIVIPDLAAIDYRILSNEVIEIPTRSIMPSKGHFTRNIDPMTVPYSFNKIYEKNVWYPSKSIELSDPYIVRDLRGMTIQFNPLSYNPLLNELRVNKKIVVEYFNDNLKESVNPFIRMTPFKGITKEYEDVYKTLFVNYSKGVHEYTPIPEPGKLLIIYNSVYATQIQQLYDWKVLKGIPTVLAEYPTATGTGATAIKNYILNMYNQPGSVTYIILVGESNQIPYLTGNYESAPSDPCYVKLVGSDAYPDAYISRISPTSTDNLAYIIKKIIKYERDPDTGVGSEWYHKAVGVASDEFGGTPLADWQRMDLIRDTLLNHGFISVDKIYDPGASGTMVANSVNAGRSLINYIGHGSGTSWSTTGFNVTQIKSLTNGYKNPFILDVACQNGNFTSSECMEEAWLRAGDTLNPKGAIAVYGSTTNTSWVPPCDMQSHAVYLLANKLRNTVGGISFNGVMKAMDLWGGSSGEGLKLMEQYHIFGDCSMVMNFGLIPDLQAPDAITNLTADDITSNSILINWTAPLDSSFGGVTSYDIRYSTTPINANNFSSCPMHLVGGQSDSAGTPKSYRVTGLNFSTTYYIAIKSRDMWGNESAISNLPNATTLGAPAVTFSVDSLRHQLLPNTSKLDSIIIFNNSNHNSTLDYNIELTNNTFPENSITLQVIPVVPSEISNDNEVKGTSDERFGVSLEGHGGPDTFGYEWIDSDEPNGPQYTWADISTTGTIVSSWTPTGTFSATDEGYAGPINLGFNFKFYGNPRNQIYISSNGYITFSPITTNSYTNAQLPTSTSPNEIICPFWDDLDAKAPGTVHYKLEGDRIIIQWTNYQRYSGTASYTFQLILQKSGKITAYYNNMTGTINSASIGIENLTGTVGLPVAYNATYIKNNLALKIAAEPEWLSSTNNAGTIYSGNSAKLFLNFDATDLAFGDYSMDLVFTTNDPQHQAVTMPIRMRVSDVTPVELTSLRGETNKNSVVLKWSTASETNNRGFEIEVMKENDKEWSVTGFVVGKGNTAEMNDYTFNHRNLTKGKYTYRLKQIDYDGSFEYSPSIELNISNPDVFALNQNYPNPFNPITKISYQLPTSSHVELSLYDVIGNLVTVLVNKEEEAGFYEVSFDATKLSSGTYFYKLSAGENFLIKKMVFLK